MGTLHLAVTMRFSHLEATPGDWLPARLVFYFLTLAPRDYVTYCRARGLAVGVWPPISRDGPVSGFFLHVHEHLPSALWVVGSGSLATLCSSYTHGLRAPRYG